MEPLKTITGVTQEAILSLKFSCDKGRRPLQVLRQDPPWRVVRSFTVNEYDRLMHIHNLSGGVLGGDQLMLRVEVEEGARVQLTSTGATRIYRHREGRIPAHSSVILTVGKNALLEYLPDQLIPYAGSCFNQETEVELSGEGAGLFWWETLTAGRSASGEKFAYERMGMRSQILCDGRPIVIDQFVVEPTKHSPQRVGVLGNFECCSTLYICQTGLEAKCWQELQQLLEDEAETISTPAMQWGASRLVEHGIIVRGLGFHASLMQSALARFWAIAKFYLYGREAILPRKVN